MAFSPANGANQRAQPHPAFDEGDRHAHVHVLLLAVAILGLFLDVDAQPPRARRGAGSAGGFGGRRRGGHRFQQPIGFVDGDLCPAPADRARVGCRHS